MEDLSVVSNEDSTYVRFSSRFVETRPPIEQPLPKEIAKSVYGIDGGGIQSWDALVSWSLTATRAQSSFLTDRRGRVVALDGELSMVESARAARWLVDILVTRPIPDVPEGELLSISAEFEGAWLTGIVVFGAGDSNGALKIVGLVSKAPLFHDARRAVVEQTLATARGLKEI
jgi:hypothetical protein